MRQSKKASLILEDGTVFTGYSFGYEGPGAGEVVFNTAMTGYPESLTDPSYEGQILVTTFPLQGNYGVPDPDRGEPSLSESFESERIHCRGLIVQDYSWEASHWKSGRTLDRWLKDEHIPAIYDIDTRALTKHLREHGSMLGKIVLEGGDDIPFYDPNRENLVAATSTREVETYEPDSNDRSEAKTVVLVDCGVKHNIVRCLVRRGVRVVRVPWDYDFSTIDYDGLFISNGPGNPDMARTTIAHLRKAMQADKPICGICMGNQLMALAAGASTFKLKYGHRSHNQPVIQAGTRRCFVTSQNHGFAVDTESLPDDWEALYINLNDGTNEGIRHKTKPFFSAQFHPEAASGPKDTEFIFDDFVRLL